MNKPLLVSYFAAGVSLLVTALQITRPSALSTPIPAEAPGQVAAAPAQPQVPRKRDFLNQEARGLYVTSWIAGMKRFREIADGMASSELNTLVIDIKDCSGKVGYDSAVPLVAEIKAHERRIRDLGAVLNYCQERKIHTIARIAVFQDPVLASAKPELAVKTTGGATWKDRNGQTWVDSSSRKVWEYNLNLAKEAASRGFDEVQFDYVRFPTDGRLEDLAYPLYKADVPKHQVIKEFFRYLDQELKPLDVLVSADIFGLTTVAEDDLNIGQKIDDIAPYVDYLCPMVYPSHYPPGYMGFAKPAEHPYKVVYDSCVRGLDKIKGQRAKLRPWIQDFDLGAIYDRHMILEQIQALRDAGAFGFCAWNARNVYTTEAYKPPLPQANPNPPFRAALTAELERRHQAKASQTQGNKSPNKQ
ncbi:MAG: putative glycoside hydrolase [Acidobacteriia bacterium]|nr:putative glycoside hydrolase [Terriglobia bacterium]